MSSLRHTPDDARFFSFLGRLAAAAQAIRPGTSSPGASAPLAGAPAAHAPEAVPIRGSRLRRSLRAATAEGMLTEVIGSCAGGAVLTGWALHLGASPLVAGLLVALPQMAQLFQLPAAWTTAWLGHRRACVVLVGASRQVLLPLALLPFLTISPASKHALLLAVSGLSAILGVLGNNAWVAWMGELVPRRMRGRYFGRRSGLCMLGGALTSAVVGAALDGAASRGLTAHVLAALQVVASVTGVATTVLMLRQHDPCPGAHVAPVALARSVAPFRDPVMRGLLRYQLAWQFAVGLSSGFFALHMLKNLKMGFRLVALHGTVFALARMLTAPLWGRLLDRVGARPILLTCSFAIAGVPFLWLLPTEQILWPLALDAVLAGVLWCGHALASFALPLSVAPREGRPYHLAAIAGIGGVSFTAATLLAGGFAKTLPDRLVLGGHVFWNLQLLFALSGCLRFAAAFCAFGICEPSARSVGALFESVRVRLRSFGRQDEPEAVSAPR